MFQHPNKAYLTTKVKPYGYDMLVARIEPENNIATIINAFINSKVSRNLLVIGNMNTKLGKELKSKIKDNRVIFWDMFHK